MGNSEQTILIPFLRGVRTRAAKLRCYQARFAALWQAEESRGCHAQTCSLRADLRRAFSDALAAAALITWFASKQMREACAIRSATPRRPLCAAGVPYCNCSPDSILRTLFGVLFDVSDRLF